MPRIKIAARKPATSARMSTSTRRLRGSPPGKTKPRDRQETARARRHAASKHLRSKSETPCRHVLECSRAASRGRRAPPAPGSGNAASRRNRTAYNRCTIDGFHNHRLVISLRRYLFRKLPDPYETDSGKV